MDLLNNNKDKKPSSFFSEIKGLFSGTNQKVDSANNFKKEKEEIKDYQEIINRERMKRQNQVVDVPGEKKYSGVDRSSQIAKGAPVLQTNFPVPVPAPTVEKKQPKETDKKKTSLLSQVKNFFVFSNSTPVANNLLKKEGDLNSPSLIPPQKIENRLPSTEPKIIVSTSQLNQPTPVNTVLPKIENINTAKIQFAKTWEAPKIIKTNLVEGQNTTFIDWHSNFNLVLGVIFFAVIIIGGCLGGLLLWEKNLDRKSSDLDQEIGKIKIEVISNLKEVESIDLFQEKLKYANLLLQNHIYFTNLFVFLEKNLLPNVYLMGDFSAKKDGNYSFSMETDNFKTMSGQVLLLKSKKDAVKEVKVSGGRFSSVAAPDSESPNKEVLDFNIQLVIDSNIFLKNVLVEAVK